VQQFLFDPNWQLRFPFLVASVTTQQATSTQTVSEKPSHADKAASAADDRHEGQVQQ